MSCLPRKVSRVFVFLTVLFFVVGKNGSFGGVTQAVRKANMGICDV